VSWIVGSDTGGTFTDMVAVDPEGRVRLAKVPSTYPDLEQGVLHGLSSLEVGASDVRMLFHATTVATNAAITRAGAKTALITTTGFRDVLELRRVDRKELYDVLWDPPDPLVPRRDRLEVRERIDFSGRVVEPIDEAQVRACAAQIRKISAKAVAVVFINSFANPTHERIARDILEEELPEVIVSISSDILPEPPEFERTATTTANAYLAPTLARYMTRLYSGLQGEGYHGRVVLVMHNAGGTMTSEYAKGIPIRTLNSGPAGGAIAGAAIARALGRRNAVCLDMGGTSADVSLVLDGEVLLTNQSEVEWGLPIRFPSIDIVSVGAGGGSIAWIDSAGVIKVGPQSAGSSPGPACYGNGGVEPTITDAHVVLGSIGTEALLGGVVRPDRSLAQSAVTKRIAEPLGIEVGDAAQAIIRIANSNMVRPLRLVTVERGYDPREFSLIIFGGAGPLHGVELAKELGIPEVIVPPHPGVTSAMGVLSVPPVDDFSQATERLLAELDIEDVRNRFAVISERVSSNLRDHGVLPADLSLDYSVDLRYVGQLHSLIVPLHTITEEGFADARRAFDSAHDRQYRYSHPEWQAELVTIRVAARGRQEAPPIGYAREAQRTGLAKTLRKVRFVGTPRAVETPVIDRGEFAPGELLDGPAILEQPDSTIAIPPGSSAEFAVGGELVIRVD
jgi:N-methylhydantoinase A